MKPLRLLLTCFCMLFSAPFIFAQIIDKTKTNTSANISGDLFNKGMNSYTLRQNFLFDRTKIFENGQQTFKSNTLGINGEWNYWLGKGFGAGMNFNLNSSGNHFNNTDQLSRQWTVNPTLSYGTSLSDDWNAYLRSGIIIGKSNQIYKTGSTSTDNEANIFGYNATAAFPWEISKQTALVPSLIYRHERNKYDDGKIVDNIYGLNLTMEDYLSCGEIKCDHCQHYKLSLGKYDQGNFYLNYNSLGTFNFGKSTTTYNSGPGGPLITKFSDINIDFGAAYYIANYLALGGDLNLYSNVQKSDDNTFKNTWTGFNFEPQFTLHAPVDNGFRNFFIRGGGVLGSRKFEFKSGSITNSDNYGISGFQLGIGQNTFITDETAIQTYIRYRHVTEKDKDNNDKTKTRGVFATIGFVHNF